ncbi:AraC family transcriptional regulator [Actinocorallia populi]|uniref:AraC family transcriptional regulator n=1 Tax=Actinocorallia populi TaxID=2079200 RepID=UPI000D0957D8|nr:AraC family transcriptional regulator [Actinocorallia populi]
MSRFGVLERHTILRSAGVEEFCAGVSAFLTPHRLVPADRGDVRSDLAAVSLGPVTLVYGSSTGGALGAELTEQVSYYDVNLALAGRNLLSAGDADVLVAERTAGIISPRMLAKMRLSDGYRQLHVRIERHALERHLEELLERTVPGPIGFRPAMDLTVPAAASWARAVRLLVRDLEGSGGLAMMGEHSPWARFLMTGLLLAQPHDYSEQLAARRIGPSRPGPLKRAIDLIEASPEKEHTVERLAAKTGVSQRSLQRYFKEHTGVSPREFLLRTRLERAHRDLQAARPGGATVADIALRWGFTHVPRFAGSYREHYGVPPSETLRS